MSILLAPAKRSISSQMTFIRKAGVTAGHEPLSFLGVEIISVEEETFEAKEVLSRVLGGLWRGWWQRTILPTPTPGAKSFCSEDTSVCFLASWKTFCYRHKIFSAVAGDPGELHDPGGHRSRGL